MRYIVNANNYITAISFGCKIECQDDGCTEYTGSVPTGYTSLEDWYADEAEKLYRWKIVNGQLTLVSDATAPADGITGKAPNDDPNQITQTGFYSAQHANLMPGSSGRSHIIHVEAMQNYAVQFQFDLNENVSAIRKKLAGTWGEWRNIDPSAFAPDGYGLGSENAASAVNDANLAVANGWYKCSSSVVNIPAGCYEGWIFVESYNASYKKQTYNYEVDGGLVAQRFMKAGVWGDWDWVNPPMRPNTEYRTTKRFNRLPVYTYFLKYGYYSKATTSIPHGISGIVTPVSIDVMNNEKEILTNSSGVKNLTLDRTSIGISCDWDMGDAFFLLEYTKEA